jgi:hypothetical protein
MTVIIHEMAYRTGKRARAVFLFSSRFSRCNQTVLKTMSRKKEKLKWQKEQ